MAENEFLEELKEAISARQDWFEQQELPKLKSELRAFHTAVSALYRLFVQKGFIAEDPYKNDMKISELNIPETGPLSEGNKRDQIGMRLSALDNQLDFLCNFYEFNMKGFTQDKIKIMLGLIRYIEWNRLTPESTSVITQGIADVITQMRRAGSTDIISAKTLTDSLVILEKGIIAIAGQLKQVSDFNRELYKFDMRMSVTAGMQLSEATIATIKKRFAQAMPGTPFYQELAEELVKEDFSKDSSALQAKLLKKLAVGNAKPAAAKSSTSFKPILIDGLNAIGASGAGLAEIMEKMQENHELLQNQDKGLWRKLKKIMTQMANKEPEPVIYNLEYADPVKGTPIAEKVNFNLLTMETGKKISILNALASKGTAAKKLEGMEEKQLIEILQRNIKDVQKFHNTLSGLDEHFKNAVDKADRSRIKGVKPELSALKNALSKATGKLHDYHAEKEEEEQFKRLGIDPAG
jgi:hypothetical protein